MEEALKVFAILFAVVSGPMLSVMLIPALVKRLLGTDSARRRAGSEAETEGELDMLTRRVAELEERVDFAERLLAQQREGALPRPRS